MGHIDHGKTTILDFIRKTQIQKKEDGGITQSIGAYQVEVETPEGRQKITFIDTPGHEVFTAMRARGGKVADIVILVVAANAGVQPQTVEAIHHAKAAKVPIIVAINKMDLPEVKARSIYQQLLKEDVVVEKLGGDVVMVEVSGLTGQGIDQLLEMILLLAQMQEITADIQVEPSGVVIEGNLNPKKGPVATLIVQQGVLKLRDIVLVGNTFGRIRQMTNWKDEQLKKAYPSTPVEILGLKDVPQAGEKFQIVESEKEAEKRLGELQEKRPQPSQVTEESKVRPLNAILKAESQGSLEAVSKALERLTTKDVPINFVHQGVGNITEADVNLAVTSSAIVLGFRVGIDKAAESAAQMERVLVKTYSIVYRLLEEVEAVIKGKEEKMKTKIWGRARVLKTFELSDGSKVAGCRVTEGVVKKGYSVLVRREKEIVHEGKITSIRHQREKISEAEEGVECGIIVEPGFEFAKEDILESVEKPRK